MRLFVALEVPDAWREAARATMAELTNRLDVRLRAVDPSLMHLTLRFLGEVPEGRAPPLIAALNATASPIDVALELSGPGTFGRPERTQVVWLGVGGDLEALHALAARVESAVRAAGLPPEERAFSPHLTLARLGRQLTTEERRAVAAAVSAMPTPPPLPFRASEAVLVRSHLGGPQPQYEALARIR